MGQRGPKPKPSAQQKREGTYRADRRRGEPEAEASLPPVPEWLDEQSRRYWSELGPWLVEAGLLTRLDQTALALLCRSLTDYLQACEVIEAAATASGTKFVAYTESGNVIQHPAVGVANRAWERLVKLLREFGMTPSSRAGLHLPAPEKEDDLLALIKKRYEQPPAN